MNLLQLKNLTASYLDDLDMGYFTSAQLTVWLNNSQRKVQRILIDMKQNYYLKCVEAQTVTNQCNLALPQDFMMAHRVEIITGGTYPNEQKFSLVPITLMQQDLLAGVPGVPQAYYFKRNNLCFASVPNQVYTIRLTYSYEVTDMTSDVSVPDVPTRYHELLSMYACLDGFVKDDRDNAYMLAMVDKYIEDMKAEAQTRQEQQARSVVSMDNDSYGMGY